MKPARDSQKGGAPLEGFRCGRILLWMPRPGLEAHESVPLERLVDPIEGERLAELTVQNALNLRSSERRDAVSWRGAGLHPLHKASLLVRRQPWRAARWRASLHGLDTAIAVGICPTLHDVPTAAHGGSDFERLPPLQHKHGDGVGVAPNPRQRAFFAGKAESAGHRARAREDQVGAV